MKYIKIIILVVVLFLFDNTYAQVPTVINVEIDYMVSATHSHKPSQSEIDAVKQMFACHGITLNILIDDAIPHANVLRRNPDTASVFFNYNNGLDTYGGIKNTYFDSGSNWHYCIFGHQYQNMNYTTSNSSGLGEQPGDDFLVTLGAFTNQIGTAWDRAATIAHELGHNLGLSHSGNMDNSLVGDNTPNLPSVMSYFYQLAGVRNNLECQGLVPPGLTLYKNLDYSNGRACTVDENALNEAFGIGIKPVDWDCDGSISGIASQDISDSSNSTGWCGADGNKTLLNDYDEWSHIYDVTAREQPYISQEVSCITYDEYMSGDFGGCTQPDVVIEPCTNNEMFYVTSSGQGFVEGSCSKPFANFGTAYTVATDGDIIYLLPGNHSTGTGTFIISKKILIGGSGTATLGQ